MRKITYKTAYTILCLVLSLGLLVLSLLMMQKNGLFLTLALYSGASAVFTLIGSIKLLKIKDGDYYELRRFSGKFLFSVIFPLDFGLLFLMFFRPEDAYVSPWMLYVYLGAGLLFLLLFLLRRIGKRTEDNAPAAFDFTSFLYHFYAFLILLVSYFGVDFHAVWFIVLFIIINSVLTLITVYLPVNLIASGFKRTDLGFKDTIREFAAFLKRHQIFYFIGIGFMILMGILYLAQDNTSTVYQSLFYLYVGLGVLKIVFSIWSRKLKNGKDAQRSRYKIMMVSGIFLLALVSAFSVSVQYLTTEKSKTANLFLWFFFVQVPFILWRFSVCIIDLMKSREKNPYETVRAAYGFASMLLSIYGLIVTLCMYLDFTYKNYIILISAGVTILFFIITGAFLLVHGIRGMKNRT